MLHARLGAAVGFAFPFSITFLADESHAEANSKSAMLPVGLMSDRRDLEVDRSAKSVRSDAKSFHAHRRSGECAPARDLHRRIRADSKNHHTASPTRAISIPAAALAASASVPASAAPRRVAPLSVARAIHTRRRRTARGVAVFTFGRSESLREPERSSSIVCLTTRRRADRRNYPPAILMSRTEITLAIEMKSLLYANVFKRCVLVNFTKDKGG
ncbi:hypothetical protein EVAR_31879_1 [Eumeta japonica]|uniref:Uncharacterized protein n=1 Tax=Eumeta variegata TaxID=151549 RepID=A0A4C1WZ39_EUMVA|nr:hypothetical protein EVAR_31879_1 [Eumeta japonica]